ncbi:MAG: DUF739 family protein [Selenomonadaceae bacterium]|nr:DUF739 family protein [Selenomonadaceae bacterium]
MSFDYSKLKGRILEKCGTKADFAKLMGATEQTISLRLNNKRTWKQNDILKACQILDIAAEDVPVYFFTLIVQK